MLLTCLLCSLCGTDLESWANIWGLVWDPDTQRWKDNRTVGRKSFSKTSKLLTGILGRPNGNFRISKTDKSLLGIPSSAIKRTSSIVPTKDLGRCAGRVSNGEYRRWLKSPKVTWPPMRLCMSGHPLLLPYIQICRVRKSGWGCLHVYKERGGKNQEIMEGSAEELGTPSWSGCFPMLWVQWGDGYFKTQTKQARVIDPIND